MNEPVAIATWLVIAITCVVSFLAFRSRAMEERYIFCPQYILADKQFYRLLSSGFLHANGQHLCFNMISLFLFGSVIETWFGWANFLTIYFGSILGGSLLSLWLHRHHDYRAYGASGGVCGLIFGYIFLFPGSTILHYGIIPMPAWLYAIVFMAASIYALKRRRDNIGHDAHLGGAIIGLLVTTALHPDIATTSPQLFAAILTISILFFAYLVVNPLLLPMNLTQFRDSLPSLRPSRYQRSHLSQSRRATLKVDDLLEKISTSGLDALTDEERAFLKSTSQKYQNRSMSKGKKSDLVI